MTVQSDIQEMLDSLSVIHDAVKGEELITEDIAGFISELRDMFPTLESNTEMSALMSEAEMISDASDEFLKTVTKTIHMLNVVLGALE